METQAVKDLLVASKAMDHKSLRATLDTLSDEERKTFYSLRKESYFDPKNKIGDPIEKFSPSGKYRLVLEKFSTGNGTWAFTQGTIYRVGSSDPVGVIKRNYSAFPYLFVEGHPKGDFFIGGEDYQGQTVIELGTGIRRDLLPEEAKKGGGFCWADYEYLPEHQLLLVEGCYWACSYEFRFYDFSDPLNGWPLLEIEGEGHHGYIDHSEKKPTLDSNGVVTVFQVKDPYDYKSDYEVDTIEGAEWIGENPTDPDDDNRITVVSTKTYKIQDKKVVFQSEYVSPIELAYREEQVRRRIAYEARLKEFQETDPLYLAFVEGCKDPSFSLGQTTWRGWTHDNWCSDWRGNEARQGRALVTKGPMCIELEWAVVTGPVLLHIHQEGSKETKVFHEHSVESMNAAFAYAKALLKRQS